MNLCRVILSLSLIFILDSPLLAQDTKPSSDLQQKIKTLKNGLQFSVRYYEITDTIRVSVGPFDDRGDFRNIFLRETIWMMADFSFHGRNLKEQVKELDLVFASRSPDWLFLDNNDLYAIVDGERIDLGKVERRDSHHWHHYADERIVYKLPIDIVRKIANAKAVELKVGPSDLKLKGEHLMAFRSLLSLMELE